MYEVVQNFFFSSKVATTGRTHIRDRLDVQRVMVVVWLATFPAMFWGIGLISHYFAVFGMPGSGKGGSEWEQAEVEKELKKMKKKQH